MSPDQLRIEIIRPVLKDMGLWSVAVEQLLLGTAIHESDGLKRIRQYGGGPALSYYQMEPDTLNDLYDNYLRYRPQLFDILEQYKVQHLSNQQNLTINLAYATAATRLQYFRVPEKIPVTLKGQGDYWKKYWNTNKGKGSVEQYINHYKQNITKDFQNALS